MTPSRRQVLGGAAAAAGEALAPHAMAESPAHLSFLVIGDWGRDGSSHQRDVAGQMERAAGEFDCRFVVAVGDNFYEDGVQSVTDPKWRTSFEDVYTGPRLQKLPWYAALGNHDYGGVPQAQVDYTAHSARWTMPARYFEVPDIAGGQIGLFILDTSPLIAENAEGDRPMAVNVRTEDGAAQLAWLDRRLAASHARFKLVFGHHTVFSGGSTHGDTPDLIAHLLPVLKRHGVTAYINGHDHDLQHIVRDGIDFVCTGAGSEVRPVNPISGTRFCTAHPGFSAIALRDGLLSLEFRGHDGTSLYSGALGAV